MRLTRTSQKKRKSGVDSDNSENGQVPLIQASVEERLDAVGVPIGSKTPRCGLLDLLGKHIQRKRFRTDENLQRIKPASQKARGRQHETSTFVPPTAPPSVPPTVTPVIPASFPVDEVQTPTTDFGQFNDPQLADLLRTVGVDTGPLDRVQLITQCQAYHELIIIPAEFYTNTTQSTTFQTSSAFTLEVPFGDSPPIQSTSNSQTQLPSTNPQQPLSTAVEDSESFEYSRSSDSIIEDASPVQTSSTLPRVIHSLPKENIAKNKGKKKNDQPISTAPDLSGKSSSSFKAKDTSIQLGGDGDTSEDISHLSTRRTSRSSTVKTALGSTSSPALVQVPSSSSSSKANKSKTSSRASTSKGSRVPAIVQPQVNDQLISTSPDLSQNVSSSSLESNDTSIQTGGDGAQSDDVSHSSRRRTSRSSTLKTALDSTSSPALVKVPSSNLSPKATRSKTSSRASTSKGSRVSAIARPEASAASLCLAPTTSQKGKGVDRGGVTCLASDPQLIVQDHASSMSHSHSPRLSDLTSQTPVPSVPSLEHGCLAYPRPNPTTLDSSSNSSKQKSKKHHSHDSGSEWELNSLSDQQSDISSYRFAKDPNLGSTRGHHNTPFSTNRPSLSANRPQIPSSHAQTAPTTQSGVDENTGAQQWSIPELKRRVAEDAILIRQLQDQTNELNERVESLTEDLRALSRTVGQLKKERNSSPQKTRGGRTASHMRFHIDTLLGLGSQETQLPEPASEEEKSSWMRDTDPSAFDFDPTSPFHPNLKGSTADPCFPYPNGPGHIKSTPQQLTVMWQMMRAVGVSSFRPDFSQSPQSDDNKWLWSLALRIFTKLVECGEYNGVSLEPENSEQIKRCMSTYVGSLSKRNRQQNWDEERKRKGVDETRRKARMRHLSSLRDESVMSKEALYCISSIVEVACSDDETDNEAESPNKLRPSIPCRIRRLPWRSLLLEQVFIALDSYKAKLIASIPKNTHGRPPRPRLRTDNAPSSPIKPPAGLPIDCYSSEWLASLSPRERSTLEINPTPILPRVITTIESLV